MMSLRTTVLPRSFLYVPANRPDLYDKAAAGHADALILDLEDAVPVPQKGQARTRLGEWLSGRAPRPDAGPGPQLWSRINAESVADDLDAVTHPALDGIVLAKCSVGTLREASVVLSGLELTRGLPAGSIDIVGLVETAAALVSMDAMAADPRLVTFGVGEVDLLGDVRITKSERTAAAVDSLRTQIVVQCAALGLQAPVAPTSTAFRDLDAFRESTRLMLELGFRSRTAIHPSQVDVIHEMLTPTVDDLREARDVLERFDTAGGGITTDLDGRLIDAAVVRAARETLSRAPRARRGSHQALPDRRTY